MKKISLPLVLGAMVLLLSSCALSTSPKETEPPEVELFEALADPWCAALDAEEVLLSDIGAQLAEVEAAYAETGLLETEIARGGSRTVGDYLDLNLPVLNQDPPSLVTRERWGDSGYESVVGGDCKFFTGLSDLARDGSRQART